MEFTTGKIRELIESWKMKVVPAGDKEQLHATPPTQREMDKYWEHIRANKATFVAEIKKVEAEKVEREANIKDIEGLQELKNAINAEERYRHEFDRRMEDEMLSSIAPDKPKVSVQELKAKYPRAAAYIKAESWKNSSNVRKYNAGKKALERIVAGEDYEQVLADMEAEWTEYTRTRMWD